MQRSLQIVLALLCFLWAASGAAQSWDPVPSLGEADHLAIKRSLDGQQFDSLRECLADFDSEVGAQYFAVVVDITHKDGVASARNHHTVAYVDQAYQAYRAGGRLDPDTHILIALGIKNRGVAIHPGNRWAKLGFETQAIKQTIDGSAFPRYARNGDYPQAVCSLARAVDTRLGELVRQLEEQRDEIAARIEQASERADALPGRAVEAVGEDGALAADVDEALPEVRALLEDARRALDRDWISKASSAVWNAERQLGDMNYRVESFPEAVETVTKHRRKAESLAQAIATRPDADWSGPARAGERLSTCQSQLDEAREALDAGENPGQSKLSKIHGCLFDVEAELEKADVVYTMSARVLPIAVGVVVLVAVMLLLIWQIRRRRRLDDKVAGLLDTWERKLQRASERLMKLESEFSFYFDSSRETWAGASGELDQDCADAVNRAFLLFSEASRLHERAVALREGAKPLMIGALEEAWDLLTTTDIEFSTGEREERRRIFLPMTRTYSGTADQMLDDLAEAYGEASELLDRVGELVTELDEATSRCSDLLKRIDQACARRDELGFSDEHLIETYDPLAEEHHELWQLAQTDPVAAQQQRGELVPKLLALADRAEHGNAIVERVNGELLEEASAAAAHLERLRSSGYKTKEPGFEPDRTLERLRREARQALQLVDDGRETDASKLADAIATSIEGLCARLETTEAAREQVPKSLAELIEQRGALQESIPEARAVLEELVRAHDDASFAVESDNLDELSDVLERLREHEKSIEADGAAERYLAATADIETAFDFIEQGRGLISEIHEAKQRLEAARQEAIDTRAEIEGHLSRLRRHLDGGEPGLSDDTRDAGSLLESRAEQLFGRMEAETPHWVACRDEADELEGLAEAHAERVEQDLWDYREAQKLRGELEAQHSVLDRRVREEQRDRAFVHDAVDRVAQELDQWTEQLAEDAAGGTAILARGRAVKKSLAWAKNVWTSELELIEQVEAKLREVDARLSRQHGRRLGYGVDVDCAGAFEIFDDARRAMNTRAYDDAMRQLQSASQAVDHAVEHAETRYRKQRARARRRRARARRRRRSASSSSFGSHSSSSSSFGSSFSSSSSGGSSFGGTSSGGSSW
jgi:uncharacterized membrane protein YgcG